MSRHVLFALYLSLIFSTGTTVFAAPPSGGYEPGDTLDPDCAPGDTDCIVTPLIAQDEGVDLSGNVLKLNFEGAGVTSSILNGVVSVNIPGGGSSQWTTTGSDIYYTTGNVGIGTNNPQSSLVVQGDAFSIVDATGNDGVYMFGTGSGVGTIVGSDGVATLNPLSIRATNSPQLYLNTDGNIGIGTITPESQLDVFGIEPIETGVLSLNAAANIDIQGEYAYVSRAYLGSLSVIDISNPASPTSVGSVSVGSYILDVAVEGRYAYLALNATTFHVIDISNPASPTSVGTVSVNASNGADSLDVQGRYAYLTSSGSDTLQIVDISNPASPTLVSTLSTAQLNPIAIKVIGRYAYIVSGASVEVVDISNPASPSTVSSLVTSTGGSFAIENNNLYTVDSSLNLKVIDISNPSSMSVADSQAISGLSVVSTIKIQGNKLYLGATNGGASAVIQAYDITNPVDPVLIYTNTPPTRLNATSLDFKGEYMYLTDYGSGYFLSYYTGGAYIQNIESGSIAASNLSVGNQLIARQVDIGAGLNVGAGGIFSSGFLTIAPGATTTQIALKAGSSYVTDGSTILRLQDANSACDFTANAGSPSCGSDETLKKDISSIESSLSKVLGLRPTTYHWIDDEESDPLQHGFIAQEVETVFPHLVTESTWVDGTTRKFLNTGGMIPYIVGAIKDLYIEITTNLQTKRISVEEELCFEEVCLTKERVLELLHNANIDSDPLQGEDESGEIQQGETLEEEVVDISHLTSEEELQEDESNAEGGLGIVIEEEVTIEEVSVIEEIEEVTEEQTSEIL